MISLELLIIVWVWDKETDMLCEGMRVYESEGNLGEYLFFNGRIVLIINKWDLKMSSRCV